jgi:hypothetical protein
MAAMLPVVELSQMPRESLVVELPTPIVIGSLLRCGPDQSAVFALGGRAVGLLGPGEHQLAPERVPFLQSLIQPGAYGPQLGGAVFLLRSAGGAVLDVSGSLTPTVDRDSGDRVVPKLNAKIQVWVADAWRLFGEMPKPGDGAVERWIREQTTVAFQRAVGQAKPAVLGETERHAAWVETARTWLTPNLLQKGIALGQLQLVSITVPEEAKGNIFSRDFSRDAPVKAAPQPLGVGARVRTSSDGTFHSGRIVLIEGGDAAIAWDGGGETRVPVASLEPEPTFVGAHAPGTRVLAVWTDGASYPAVVRHFNGTHYEVAWENGESLWLEPGRVKLS